MNFVEFWFRNYKKKMRYSERFLTSICWSFLVSFNWLKYVVLFQAQVHLLGNPLVWWSGTAALFFYTALLTFYLLRRRRNFMDVKPEAWRRFVAIGEVLLTGYLFHYIPFFFVSRTMFLHHYLPAFVFKVLLTAGLIDHCHEQIR